MAHMPRDARLSLPTLSTLDSALGGRRDHATLPPRMMAV